MIGVCDVEKGICVILFCLFNNYVWNLWMGRCIKIEVECFLLEVVDEVFEKFREVKGE